MLSSKQIAIFNRCCLRRPRATHYQELCARIGGLMLDLPTDPGVSVERLRNSGDLYPDLLMKWVSMVLAENTLAAMLLLDALNYLTCLLDCIVGKDDKYEFPDADYKRQFTKAMGGTLIEFEVPRGWELQFAEEQRLPGFRGIALIRRCHLSDDFTHKNDAIGQLVGVPWDYETDVGYFDVSCHLDPNLAIVDGRLHKRELEGPVLDITVPYTFILHEIDRPGRDDIRLTKRPTDQEVLDIAKRAIDRLVEKASRPGDIGPTAPGI